MNERSAQTPQETPQATQSDGKAPEGNISIAAPNAPQANVQGALVHTWLRERDRQRAVFPSLPKRDRDILSLRVMAYRCAIAVRELDRLIDAEVRKP